MKSAYELAMERLEAKDPGLQLTDDQKKRIAEIEAKCKADIAAKELLLQGELAKAVTSNSPEEIAQIQRQLADEIRRFEERRDREKDAVRRGA
jgi:predicted ATPase